MSETCRQACEAALEALQAECADVQAAMAGLVRVINRGPERPAGAEATAARAEGPEPASLAGKARRGGRKPRNRPETAADGSGVLRYSREAWADRKVEECRDAGLKATKTYSEGSWVVVWGRG